MQSFAKGLSRTRIRRQSGSVATLGALWLMIAVICLATIDIGNVFWQKRELQKMADLAALAGASGTPRSGACQSVAADSIPRNGGIPSELVSTAEGRWEVRTGLTSEQYFVAGQGPLNACKVQVARVVPYLFLFGSDLNAGRRQVTASATAFRAPRLARLSVRSTLLDLDTTKSDLLDAVIGGMLGGSIKLGAVGWQGIAGADINLLKFLDALKIRGSLNVGSYDEVVNAKVSLSNFMLAMADVLPQQGNAAAITALKVLAAGVGQIQLALADVLKLGTGLGTEALRTDLNVLDMVTLLAQFANSKSAAKVGVNLDLGLVHAGVNLKVIEPAQSAIGDPDRDVIQAKTSQIDLVVGLGLNLLLVGVNLSLDVKLAQGGARVTGYQCSSAGKSLTVLGQTGVGTVALKGEATLLLSLIKIPVVISLPLQSPPQPLRFNSPPPPRLDKPAVWLSMVQPNLVGALFTALESQLGPLGTLLAAVLSPLTYALDLILNLLLSLLGLSLAQTDIGAQLNCDTNVELVY